MPLLPNLPTIPQGQFDRIVAAFPGATGAEKADAYKAWLTNRLIERVQAVEARRIDADSNAAKATALAELAASLPPRVEEPGLPGPAA